MSSIDVALLYQPPSVVRQFRQSALVKPTALLPLSQANGVCLYLQLLLFCSFSIITSQHLFLFFKYQPVAAVAPPSLSVLLLPLPRLCRHFSLPHRASRRRLHSPSRHRIFIATSTTTTTLSSFHRANNTASSQISSTPSQIYFLFAFSLCLTAPPVAAFILRRAAVSLNLPLLVLDAASSSQCRPPPRRFLLLIVPTTPLLRRSHRRHRRFASSLRRRHGVFFFLLPPPSSLLLVVVVL
ncbi:hypothetical protein PIB30_041788 [Stylosanthes scabra]|uniref:Uncharacterized protein n=1 Tax=Stylosanthes scabra TaxID=79078 RepID=A0ABU6VFT0_9FABA|nr:hypothetical protein [Stylosanthes scabra]